MSAFVPQSGLPGRVPVRSGGGRSLGFVGLAHVVAVRDDAWRVDLVDQSTGSQVLDALVLSCWLPVVHDPLAGIHSQVAYGFFRGGAADAYCVPLPQRALTPDVRETKVLYLPAGDFLLQATAAVEGGAKGKLRIETTKGSYVELDEEEERVVLHGAKAGGDPQILLTEGATTPVARKGDSVEVVADSLITIWSDLASDLLAAPVAPTDGGLAFKTWLTGWILSKLAPPGLKATGTITSGTGLVVAGSETGV